MCCPCDCAQGNKELVRVESKQASKSDRLGGRDSGGYERPRCIYFVPTLQQSIRIRNMSERSDTVRDGRNCHHTGDSDSGASA